MNAEVEYIDANGDRAKVKLQSFENLGAVVRGWQKVRRGFVRRTMHAADVTEIKELPKTKLRDLLTLTPVRVMFAHGGHIEKFSKIERHPTRKTILLCTPVDEDGDDCDPQTIEGNARVTVIFE
jgi:hypothetical protein